LADAVGDIVPATRDSCDSIANELGMKRIRAFSIAQRLWGKVGIRVTRSATICRGKLLRVETYTSAEVSHCVREMQAAAPQSCRVRHRLR